MTPELAGPIHSGVDVGPFPSEKDSYSLFPVDGVSVPVTFFEESKSHIFANIFNHVLKTLGVDWD